MRPTTARALGVLQREIATVLLVILVVVCALLSSNFLSLTNLGNLADQIPVFGILAAGQMLVILTGGIDLSVGSLLALCAFVAAALSFFGVVPALLGSLLVGAIVGAINGAGAAYTRVPPFIVTLAMLSVVRGVALEAAALYHGASFTGTGASPVSASREHGFPFLAEGNILGLPTGFWIAAAIFALLGYVLRYTRFGRHVYAIGGNETAALLLGVDVRRVKVAVYALSGTLAGLAGALYASRELSAPPTAAVGYELDAITAVVVGGTLLTGGVGTVRGTIVGLLVVRILPNIFNLLGLDPAWQQVARGGILLAVVMLQLPIALRSRARKLAATAPIEATHVR